MHLPGCEGTAPRIAMRGGRCGLAASGTGIPTPCQRACHIIQSFPSCTDTSPHNETQHQQ